MSEQLTELNAKLEAVLMESAEQFGKTQTAKPWLDFADVVMDMRMKMTGGLAKWNKEARKSIFGTVADYVSPSQFSDIWNFSLMLENLTEKEVHCATDQSITACIDRLGNCFKSKVKLMTSRLKKVSDVTTLINYIVDMEELTIIELTEKYVDVKEQHDKDYVKFILGIIQSDKLGQITQAQYEMINEALKLHVA